MTETGSKRNKTIALSSQTPEGRAYLHKCRRISDVGMDGEDSVELSPDCYIWGDAFSVLPKLMPNSVDLLIADPPYNRTKQYGQTSFTAMDWEEYRAYTEQWLDLVLPLIKPTGSLYVCCDWQSSMVVGPILARRCHLRNRITWQREKGRGASANWKSGMEDIWYATKSRQFTFHVDAVRQRHRVHAPYHTENGEAKDWVELDGVRYRDTCPSNFWDDITVPFWSMAENTAHPAQKSEKLLAKLILASSREGDVILDPFAGSGTTCVTARKLGRRFIGIEQEADYCVWAQKRLEDAARNPSIQGYHDGVFWERNSR